jgi:flagellin-specific chaperone FliS
MLIAKKLKEENIAEYLLYMWQIEDIIRANKLDIGIIDKQIISGFDQPQDMKNEIREWYESLIDMMRREDVVEKGHLIVNKNVISELTELHNRLLKSAQETEYTEAYYKTLPFIVELRSKTQDKNTPELETCLAALYGFLLMRLQKKEISGETQSALSQISSFLRLLSLKYKEYKAGKLDV